jgi:polysaccharide chain length determinant protein (PEP-CTERM system associated)
MSVDFRQRSPGDFWRMVKRRKWLILLPVLTMTAAIGYVVYRLPSVYESKTVLTVKPPTISEDVVKSMTNADLTQRIETINQEVLSRSSLEPMIAKYKLYELERNAGVPTELIIERMRKNIDVNLEKTDTEKLAAFRISYRDRTPEAARNVTMELASKYVNAQVLDQQQVAKQTGDFIATQLGEKKKALDELEQQRLGIMMSNVDTLPENDRGLIAQLEGLRKREENLSKDIQSLSAEKSRLQDNVRSLNRQIQLVEDLGQKDIEEALVGTQDITKTPAYGNLIRRRAELNAELKKLKTQYTDKMPKVVDTRERLKAIDVEIGKLRANAIRIVADAKKSSNRKAEMQKQSFVIEREKTEGQIKNIDAQVTQKRAAVQANEIQIGTLEAKINTIPSVKVALESINNQYQSAKRSYDDLLKKKNDTELQLNRDRNVQGETIRVVDPANLPKSPVAPKRELLTGFGGGVGLMIGLFLAALFELPRLFKIQSIEDAKHYTGLPLLASVPPLLSHNEIAWQKRSHWLKVLAGVGAAIGAIPIIIMVLEFSRVFERAVS